MKLPNHLHFIWLGSPVPNSLQYPYRRRILDWKEQNPEHQVFLWTDLQAGDLERLQLWANKYGILLQTIEQIQWGTEKSVVRALIEQRYFANASDLLRLRILYQWGGFYFDFDVSPSVLPLVFQAPLGILMKLQKQEEQLSSISLYALGAQPGHELLQLALWEGVQNLQLVQTLPDLDFRAHENPTVRYGATLALTGDIIRPALAQVAGFFPVAGYPWTLGLEWMRFLFPLEHLEEHSWIQGEVDHVNPFYPEALLNLIKEREKASRTRALSSILHWAAAFGPAEMISEIAKVIAPFESYFGSSPRGIAIRYQREQGILDAIPSM